MHFDRPLFIFDLETTGPDPIKDRIVQIAYRRIGLDGNETANCALINPGRSIPAAATAVHGIDDSMVAQAPRFRQIAKSLLAKMEGCDLVGYNIRHFDVPMLWEEFNDAGIAWDAKAHRCFDLYALWQKMAPRKLANALAEFAPAHPQASEDLHDAARDVEACQFVMSGMLNRWGVEIDSPDAFAKACTPVIEIDGEQCEPVDIGGVLARRPDGVIVYTHQKVRGKQIKEDTGWAQWILSKPDFSENTKNILRSVLHQQAAA